MIVRIATEDQYTLDDSHRDALNQLDNDAVAAVEAGDEARFKELFGQMLDLVRREGSPVPDEELVESEVILPPGDLTFEEAKGEFTGEGLIPD
jgi:hypothetical protein